MTQPGELQPLTREYQDRLKDVYRRYKPQLLQNPQVSSVGRGYFTDADGRILDTAGIQVYVRELVDQTTLPEADRIPNCIEGIPVEITTPEVMENPLH